MPFRSIPPRYRAPGPWFPRHFASVVILAATILSLAACGGGGESDSLVAASPDYDGTALPSNGDASGMPGAATLTWDAVSHASLSGYRIYYGTAPGHYAQPHGQGISVGNVTSFTLTGLSSGTRYYFAVTTVDATNNESGFSNEVFKDVS